MSRFWPLASAPAVGRARWPLIIVISLAVIAPMLVVLALAPKSGGDAVPAAIVNLDVPIQDADSTVAAGKLLTQNLVTSDDDIAWTLTDADTASAGLADGTFQAVVTIPADFSKTVSSISTDDPSVSTLAVQTSTEHGYVGGVVAEAVAVGLPADVSQELTQEYVAGTLAAFAELHDGLSELATGVAGLQEGTDAATAGAEELAADAQLLADGIAEIDRVIEVLPQGATDLGTLSADGAAASASLAESLAASSFELAELAVAQSLGVDALGDLEDAVRADPTAPAGDFLDEIAALRQGAAVVEEDIAGQSRALAADAADAAVIAVGAEGIAVISGPVAQGLTTLAALTDEAAAGSVGLAEGISALATGLVQLGAATDEVATGTDEIAASVPDYSDDQQKDIASVVAQPITSSIDMVAGPPSALAATLAAVVPISLWLGAMATFTVIAPFSRSQVSTSRSPARIAIDGALVAIGVGTVQAVLVWLAMALLGAAPERLLVAFGLILAAAIAFALVHQALVALLGRVGLVFSAVALGLQLVASGTLVAGIHDPTVALLPLSIALQGGDALMGGSLHAVLASAVGLGIWAVLAVIGTGVAVARERRRTLAGLVAGAV
ncbi:hypothetical protein [Microbacterium xanthum]|uniref:hypothetical protein n=1 Tax=Microbacterium xanthum TaxID=3079794 RepID=UPI002AD3A07E|nr:MULTISPECIES: hypothetical protein [unclassified Microbacterium]MDZ8171347.1 hypothetical protein [Microbacterium sp. KSW-48]MDZ8201842.1 hypothetical protein [Microbacterium sp. SSW1-59]